MSHCLPSPPPKPAAPTFKSRQARNGLNSLTARYLLSAHPALAGQQCPEIYPQGSFRLGTVVRPIANYEYDIDLVCLLKLRKEATTQKNLKQIVGDRLKKHDVLKHIVTPSRRCWLLDYPLEANKPAFHMDVLPAVSNAERLPDGILLTDTELILWQKSNPKAYAMWFYDRMRVVLMERRAALAKTIQTSLEEVPEWQVRTPLQIAVQVLKRHRDIHFQSTPDSRPASVIITTLAARSYRNQPDVYDAFIDIVRDMPQFVEIIGSVSGVG
jgi:Second Messenger Oligonucleotide or Dinucleotide Synthetase domain